jgi:hypothetical protein
MALGRAGNVVPDVVCVVDDDELEDGRELGVGDVVGLRLMRSWVWMRVLITSARWY